MLGKFWGLTFVCFLVLGVLLGFGVFEFRVVGQPSGVVVNVDTGLSYSGVQAAVDAAETLSGHVIRVGAGVFRERVVVNKSVSVVGEGPDASVIDGVGGGIVVYVTASRVEIRDLSIRNGSYGLWLHGSNNSRIIGNRLSLGSYGIRLLRSRNCLVVGNQVSGYSSFGFHLDKAANSTLKDNFLIDNRYNFGVDGTSLDDFVNDVDDSNTVNGKPVRYLINQRDLVVDSFTFASLGYLGVVNSSNVRVKDLDVQNNVQGVLLAFTPNSSISNVNARDNWNGVYVAYSSNVSVTDVKANGNFDYGIKFFNSSDARVFRSNVDNNGWAGLGLFTSHRSVVDLNEASYGKYDLHLVYTNNSLVTRNTALIRPGSYSIALYYSHGNLICRNTLETSLLYVEARNSMRFTPENAWDNGLEGNYWVSHGGRDIDSDGISDVAYKVGENNVDNYPLLGRFSEFEVGLDGEMFDVGVVSNSTISWLRLDSDIKQMSFTAVGQNGTLGFCRVAVPADMLLEFDGDSLGFLVNGDEPVVVRQWSDDARAYWYLLFVNIPFQGVSDLLLDAATFLMFLFLTAVALVVLWKRKPARSVTLV